MKNNNRKKYIIYSCCIFVSLVFATFLVVMSIGLMRGKKERLFEKQVVNQRYIWKAEEIDCVLYSKNTKMYDNIKERYQINEDTKGYIFGTVNVEGDKKTIILSMDSNGCFLSEAYYCDEWKDFQPYYDEYVSGEYKINFLKNKFVLKPAYNNNNGNNSILKYLYDNGIEEITFKKSNEEINDISEIAVNIETNMTLFNRYEKKFRVNVLSANYNQKKHQMEIMVENKNNFDINKIYLTVGIIGKTEYELIHNWKYENVLSYEEGYELSYCYPDGIEATSKIKIIIPEIDDEDIFDIMSCVSGYEYNDEYYNNKATVMFNDFVYEANEEYFKNMIN